MVKKLKLLLIAILMLPMVVFFPGCGGDDGSSGQKKNPSYYTVTFYTDSAETFNIPSQTVQEGQLIRKPQNPYKTGYRFKDWYSHPSLDPDFIWTFEIDTVTSNITLYAKWEKKDY